MSRPGPAGASWASRNTGGRQTTASQHSTETIERTRQTHTHHITLPRSTKPWPRRPAPGAGARAAPRRRPAPQHHRGGTRRARTQHTRTTLALSPPARARTRARNNTPHTLAPSLAADWQQSRAPPHPLHTTLRQRCGDRCDSGRRYEQLDARAGCSPCSYKVVSKAVTALYRRYKAVTITDTH